MDFIGPNEFLILERNEGKVYHVTNGKMDPEPVSDVNVATDGYRGMLGITSSTRYNVTNIFLYFTEANTKDGDDSDKSNPMQPLGNRIYKYDLIDGEIVNPKLLLDLPALPGPRHPGAILAIGPDDDLYVTVGDIDGTFRKGFETMAQNYQNGSFPDGRSGILRITQDGKEFFLAPGEHREIVLRLKSGGDFSAQEVEQMKDRTIHFHAYANGILVGGMSYELDPSLKVSPPQYPGEGKDHVQCSVTAKDLLGCLNLPVDKVKSVRVRKITVDIEIEDDCDCSEDHK